MEKTPCDIELENIKKKAIKRHDRYIKNKDKVKKTPLKRDIIIKLNEEIVNLRQQLMEAQNTELKNGRDTLEDEIMAEAEADEIMAEAEAEADEIMAEAEADEIMAEAEAEAAVGYESIYEVKEEFEDINPLKGQVCKCKNNYTYDTIIEKMENVEWPSDRVKKTMIDTMKLNFELFDRIPTCKGSIAKFSVGLLGLDIPDTKKRVMAKVLLLTISKLNIELDNHMIDEYFLLYSLYSSIV